MTVSVKRGAHLPKLTAENRARWAYQLAVGAAGVDGRLTVGDRYIDHAESTRADVEALIDDLARDGCLVVMRQIGSEKSWFRINHC
jgi:hypothetical protein